MLWTKRPRLGALIGAIAGNLIVFGLRFLYI
jgi:hypothetical protein